MQWNESAVQTGQTDAARDRHSPLPLRLARRCHCSTCLQCIAISRRKAHSRYAVSVHSTCSHSSVTQRMSEQQPQQPNEAQQPQTDEIEPVMVRRQTRRHTLASGVLQRDCTLSPLTAFLTLALLFALDSRRSIRLRLARHSTPP